MKGGSPAAGSYAVIGNPSRHSLSPRIHAEFAAQLGVPYSYGLLEPELPDFENEARRFFAGGGRGLNVTVPFKQRAVALADDPSAAARAADSANTLRLDRSGRISACTTDGPGLLAALVRRRGWSLDEASILILGSGGAAASVLGSLLGHGSGPVFVANRSAERARQLCARFSGHAGAARLQERELSEDALAELGAECVINATSAGLAGQLPAAARAALRRARFACDLAYGRHAQPFLELASECGVENTSDGLGMLIEQAALSCAFWHQAMPDTGRLYEMLEGKS